MRLLIFGLLTIILVSCGEPDNFYDVTKIIQTPDTVTVDKEFEFRLTLKNNTDKKIKLTIDKNVAKSVQFFPDWTCDSDLIIHEVPNPKSQDNDYETFNLNKGDSLTYTLTGQLSTFGTDGLKFTVKGYDRTFTMKRPKCQKFAMSLRGMWIPGHAYFADAMENYDFRGRELIVRD